MRNWSIPAGRIFGVEIRIHLTFFFLLVFVAVTESATRGPDGAMRALALVGIVFGSVVLHELYFANLGGDGKASADLRTRLAASFGTYDAWETEFRKIGQGLGGGSGWVVLG